MATEAKIGIIIPARLESKRLPGKVLLDILGLPMVEHVRRRGLMNKYNIPVFVASGDRQILETVQGFQGDSLSTFEEHQNGLSRVNEVSKNLSFTHYIILQGDELLILPEQIDALIEAITANPRVDFWNQVTPLLLEEEISDINIVKCLLDMNGQIMTMFRATPLTSDNQTQMRLLKKVCGLFAVSAEAMKTICGNPATPVEIAESIEQMKFLELGGRISTIATEANFISINLPSDVENAKNTLESSTIQKYLVNLVLGHAE
jgi:3-deoxy-manno-octulosonate cytidylyltransferase (CMP-KDO synthetase)